MWRAIGPASELGEGDAIRRALHARSFHAPVGGDTRSGAPFVLASMQLTATRGGGRDVGGEAGVQSMRNWRRVIFLDKCLWPTGHAAF